MSKPCDSALAQQPLGKDPINQLYNSPKSYNYQGRHPYELPEESKKEYRVNTCMGEQQEIGAENA